MGYELNATTGVRTTILIAIPRRSRNNLASLDVPEMPRCAHAYTNKFTAESVKEVKMNYLRGFKSVLGSPSAENQPSAQETVSTLYNRLVWLVFSGRFWEHCELFCILLRQIERLCDRVDSSTLLEDRRDAVRALKSLSKASIITRELQSIVLSSPWKTQLNF